MLEMYEFDLIWQDLGYINDPNETQSHFAITSLYKKCATTKMAEMKKNLSYFMQ